MLSKYDDDIRPPMQQLPTKNAWARSLVPVVVGALLSAIPVLIAVYIQTESDRKQADKARKLDVIAGYVRACNQVIVDTREVIYWHEREVEAKKMGVPFYTPEIYDEFRDFKNAVETHALELKVQTDIVNITFGKQLNNRSLSAPTRPFKDDKEIKKAIEQQKAYIGAAEKECESNAALLLSLVEK